MVRDAVDKVTRDEQTHWLDVQGSPWIDVHTGTLLLHGVMSFAPLDCNIVECGQMQQPYLHEIHKGLDRMTKAAT